MDARSAAGTDLGERALGEDAADGGISSCREHTGADGCERRGDGDLHEQTGLSTGAVTDNNELSSNLRHGAVVCGEGRVGGVGRGLGGCCGSRELAGEMRKVG